MRDSSTNSNSSSRNNRCLVTYSSSSSSGSYAQSIGRAYWSKKERSSGIACRGGSREEARAPIMLVIFYNILIVFICEFIE